VLKVNHPFLSFSFPLPYFIPSFYGAIEEPLGSLFLSFFPLFRIFFFFPFFVFLSFGLTLRMRSSSSFSFLLLFSS